MCCHDWKRVALGLVLLFLIIISLKSLCDSIPNATRGLKNRREEECKKWWASLSLHCKVVSLILLRSHEGSRSGWREGSVSAGVEFRDKRACQRNSSTLDPILAGYPWDFTIVLLGMRVAGVERIQWAMNQNSNRVSSKGK